VSSATVTVTYATPGTAGNAFTLAQTGGHITVAATLTSGAGNTGNATIALAGQPTSITAKIGTYRAACLTATTFRVYDPNGVEVGEGTFGTAFANEIYFTITAGGTPCVAGDTFSIAVSAATGRVLLPNAVWETTTAAGAVGMVRIVG
jgi:hypothetical protein